MPEPLVLREHTTAPAVALAPHERDALRRAVPRMSITPSEGREGHYDLRPSHQVGVLRIGDLQVEIRPRLRVDRVLFLLSYALDPKVWRPDATTVAADDHLFEAVVPAYVRQVRAALRRGLLHGYRHVEETHTTVRGRIRVADQLRRRPGLAHPLEVAYDDLTEDVLENRLLRAAVERLLALPLRHADSRTALLALREQFATVTLCRYPPTRVPEPRWTRLNDRYRPAVTLARLLLGAEGFDLASGPSVAVHGLLLDMADVFENFVVVALREALGLDGRSFPQGAARRALRLDDEGSIVLKPDLSWWAGNRCVFVGDCKYKRTAVDGVPNADVYQLLAYATSLGLPEGLLVYAEGADAGRTLTVRHGGPRLHRICLDLACPPDEVLRQIGELADRISAMAERGRGGGE